jgi:hypothetical protein
MSRGIFPTLTDCVARHFACPACHGALKPHAAVSGGYGWLACDACKIAYPVLSGFVHFGEPLPAGAVLEIAGLRALDQRLAGDPQAYRQFVDQAWRRPVFEPYAAFAPTSK